MAAGRAGKTMPYRCADVKIGHRKNMQAEAFPPARLQGLDVCIQSITDAVERMALAPAIATATVSL